MSKENAPPRDGLAEEVNQDVSQLIHHLRCSRAPDEAPVSYTHLRAHET